MKLRVAARRSDLARIQAYSVADKLKDQYPDLEIDFIFKKSLGDVNLHDPLWKMPEKGVFTSDLSQDLKSGLCDLVVHSWKDLPVDIDPLTEIAGTLPREDSRDLLIFKKSSYSKLIEKKSLCFFSSSPRRVCNAGKFLSEYLPKGPHSVNFQDIRGNIVTRLQKYLLAENVDGLLLAKAALDRILGTTSMEYFEARKNIRMALQASLFCCLPLSENPTAAGQGALAIEIRHDRDDIKKLIEKINCPKSFEAVVRERQWLKSFGGGCHQKIGTSVLIEDYGKLEILRGQSLSGQNLDDYNFYSFQKNTKKFDRDKIWPPSQKNELFDRQNIPVKKPDNLEALWISRSNALPENWEVPPETLVWVSGLKTWKSLSSRGVWVCGSSEGLGEDSSLSQHSLNKILVKEPRWTKLSHKFGQQSHNKDFIATYELRPSINATPQWENFQVFYWMSGSQFRLAMKQDSSLLKRGLHACGPGHTFKQLKELGLNPLLYPNFENFLKDFTSL